MHPSLRTVLKHFLSDEPQESRSQPNQSAGLNWVRAQPNVCRVADACLRGQCLALDGIRRRLRHGWAGATDAVPPATESGPPDLRNCA